MRLRLQRTMSRLSHLPVEPDHLRERVANVARVARNRDGERDEAMRVHLFRQARRATPLLGVEEPDGVRYIVSTRDSAGVGFFTFVNGGAVEADLMNRLLDQLAERGAANSLHGMRVLELGANIGTETVSMLVRLGADRVIAVEPDAENVRLLRANLALNGVEQRADVHHIAVSDVDGTLLLERSDANWGDHRIRVGEAPGVPRFGESTRGTIEVAARTVDSLVTDGVLELDAIDLVWMDVQGHEAHVLAGASSLAATSIPVLTEYWPYGLERAGGLDRFHRLVAERYATVVDLHADTPEPPETLPADRVSELVSRYVPSRTEARLAASTNLLLLSD